MIACVRAYLLKVLLDVVRREDGKLAVLHLRDLNILSEHLPVEAVWVLWLCGCVWNLAGRTDAVDRPMIDCVAEDTFDQIRLQRGRQVKAEVGASKSGKEPRPAPKKSDEKNRGLRQTAPRNH